MCFSPTASFIAGAGLAVIGAGALTRVRSRNEIALAAVPLLFATQQGIEGLLWLSLLRGETGAYPDTLIYAFSTFAGILWPLFITLSIWLIEPMIIRKQGMLLIGLVGTGVALYTGNIMFNYGVTAEIVNNCIQYDNPAPQGEYMVFIYLVATCAAFFISSLPGLQWLGLANICAFVATYYMYRINLVSVWCFLAAAVSGLIYLYLARSRSVPTLAAEPAVYRAGD